MKTILLILSLLFSVNAWSQAEGKFMLRVDESLKLGSGAGDVLGEWLDRTPLFCLQFQKKGKISMAEYRFGESNVICEGTYTWSKGKYLVAKAKNCKYTEKCFARNKKRCPQLKKNDFTIKMKWPKRFIKVGGEWMSKNSVPFSRVIHPLTSETHPSNRPLKARMDLFYQGQEPCYSRP